MPLPPLRNGTPGQAPEPALQGAQAYASVLSAAGGKLVDARQRAQDPASVGVALYASPPYDLAVPPLPVSRLSISLTPSRVSGGLDGDRRQEYQSSRYALFLAPAGAGAHWKKDSPSRHLTLYFNADALADSGFCQDAAALGAEPLMNVNMPGIRGLTDELLAEMESQTLWSAEAADSLGRLLLIRVARNHARQRSSAKPLTPQLMARLVDYVQAHLSERILVSDLAAVVGLSPSRFAQAYSACAGQPPHQFVLALRLRQAQAMLQSETTAVADVAAACGFASQQHLTQVMSKRLGVTPARFRSRQPAAGRAAGKKAAATPLA